MMGADQLGRDVVPGWSLRCFPVRHVGGQVELKFGVAVGVQFHVRGPDHIGLGHVGLRWTVLAVPAAREV